MIKGGRKKGEKRKIERLQKEIERIKGGKSYYFINTLFYSKKKYAFCNYK